MELLPVTTDELKELMTRQNERDRAAATERATKGMKAPGATMEAHTGEVTGVQGGKRQVLVLVVDNRKCLPRVAPQRRALGRHFLSLVQ